MLVKVRWLPWECCMRTKWNYRLFNAVCMNESNRAVMCLQSCTNVNQPTRSMTKLILKPMLLNCVNKVFLLISSGIFQGKRKHFAWNLKCRYCVFTWWGRDILPSFLTDSIISIMPSIVFSNQCAPVVKKIFATFVMTSFLCTFPWFRLTNLES